MTATATAASEHLREFTRELPVELNDSELQTYGRMLAEKVREQELAIDKKKQITAEHNARIKVITNEIKRLAEARAKGEELRPVMCGERLHGNVIEVVRLDRKVVVDSRPAELQDLQTTMRTPGFDIPEGFDEGPRGDDMGGPDKTGRGVDGTMSTSSSGDAVYNGAPNDVDEDTLVCDACGKIVSEEQETVLHEGSTIHVSCVPAKDGGTLPHLSVVRDDHDHDHDGDNDDAPGDRVNESEEDEIDRKLRERDAWKQNEADEDLAKRKAAEAKLAEAPADKPKRERSKAKNASKPSPKKPSK